MKRLEKQSSDLFTRKITNQLLLKDQIDHEIFKQPKLNLDNKLLMNKFEGISKKIKIVLLTKSIPKNKGSNNFIKTFIKKNKDQDIPN
jgi:hypothetical protein